VGEWLIKKRKKTPQRNVPHLSTHGTGNAIETKKKCKAVSHQRQKKPKKGKKGRGATLKERGKTESGRGEGEAPRQPRRLARQSEKKKWSRGNAFKRKKTTGEKGERRIQEEGCESYTKEPTSRTVTVSGRGKWKEKKTEEGKRPGKRKDSAERPPQKIGILIRKGDEKVGRSKVQVKRQLQKREEGTRQRLKTKDCLRGEGQTINNLVVVQTSRPTIEHIVDCSKWRRQTGGRDSAGGMRTAQEGSLSWGTLPGVGETYTTKRKYGVRLVEGKKGQEVIQHTERPTQQR